MGIEKALGKALRNASNKRDFEFGGKFFFSRKGGLVGSGVFEAVPVKNVQCHRSQTELKITQHTIEI